MSSYLGLAQKAGTTPSNIEKLITTGEGSRSLADRIGTTATGITEFVGGKVSPTIAKALGTTLPNAQILRDAVGREGAIGIIIGLACGRAPAPK